jgi:hypothetical protein
MSLNSMSAQQYGSVSAASANYGQPLSGSATTYGSVGAKTAWTTAGVGGSGPAPYSKRTKGSTLSWDDDNSGPSLPQSDSGSSFSMNRG